MEPLGGYNLPVAFLLLLLQVFSPVYTQYNNRGQQSDCSTPDSAPGRCVEISTCAELMQLLTTSSARNIDRLKESHCGFNGRNPKVCCPIRQGGTTMVTRPGGTFSNTGGDGTRGNSGTQSSSGNLTWDLSSNSNLPQFCGEDLTQRIVGGEATDPYEFPWMALLEYTKPNGRTTACGGVLISKRYVLTAAHCIKGKDLPSTWRLVSVRFGEYDTSTDIDCVPDSETTTFCMEAPVTVGVEEQIAHPDYRPQSRDQANDIALLRLARNVEFTSYIRPICLPSSGEALQSFSYVAGWGKTETRSESNIKLKLKIPLANFDTCSSTYQTTSIQLGDGQLCAGGQRGRDSCRGDSGGPLMAFKTTREGRIQWTVYGVVSFGPSPCGMQNWPGVYTKVTKYVPWILSQIRA